MFISLSISKSFLNFSRAKFILVFLFMFVSMSSVHVRLHISVCFLFACMNIWFRGCVVDAFCN